MEPVSIILGALLAGAAAATQDVTSQAIKDAYTDLRKLIVHKFGNKADLENAVTQLEAKPDSKGRQGMVQEEVENSGMADDPEVVNQAKALLDLLKQAGGLSASHYTAIVTGSGAAALGPGAAAAGARGVAVAGDVTGGINLGAAKAKPSQDEADE